MKIIDGGVTSAKGFEAASAAAGIKYQGRTDMAMIYSKKPCKTAGAFTTNLVKAAPVIWDKTVVESGVKSHVVVVNSGIANACTGEEGLRYCSETAKKAAEVMGVDANGVLIGSTGVIGMQMPMDKVTAGIEKLADTKQATREAGHLAAKAIMTTDTKEKEIAVTIEIGGKTVTVGGMAKGSGMIHPNMCTMLSYITTDAAITKKALAKNPKIHCGTAEYQLFLEALHFVNETLAKKMAGDGEGATALFEVKIVGAKSKKQAKVLAKSVVCSNLTKTAIAGHDANWGRILCAMGYSGENFEQDKVDLFFESAAGKIQLIKDGVGLDFDEEKATMILSEPEVTAIADLKEGNEQATAWGCDLTHGYIDINADYRS